MQKFPQKSLEYKVYRTIEENELIQAGDHIVVALSGGPDSVCLLKILLKLKEKLSVSVSACHFNHKMRGEESNLDEKFVKKICEEWGIDCVFGSAPPNVKIKSEEEARNLRYNFFENILQNRRGVKLAIGHNSDDLFETFLLALIRGSGLRGLRSIPLERKNLVRPLLYTSRNEIIEYLKTNKIKYIFDSSNANLQFARNFVRNKITPLLLELNPNLLETISNNIEAIGKDYDYIEKAVENAYFSVKIQENQSIIELSQKDWALLHPALRMGVLRFAIEKISDLKDITQKHMAEVENILLKKEGKKFKILPHSLRIDLLSGKIIICKDNKKGEK